MKWTTVTAGWQIPAAFSAGDHALPEHDAGSRDLTISWYENQLPPFIDYAMDRLYGSLFSSMKQFRVYDNVGPDTHTYVVRNRMRIQAVFLFRIRGRTLHVLNEVISVDGDEVLRFARTVFARYRQVHMIRFKSVRTAIERSPYPLQQHNAIEDIVVTLSPTVPEYHARLGKNTRRNIKRYGERLRTAFPDQRYETFETSDIDERDVRAIIELNRARMAGKHKTSMIDEAETRRIVRLVKKCGMIVVSRIGGRVAAGGIGFRMGDHFYLTVIAHDPQYDSYWLGMLCAYQSICETITRGAKEFHFLWGRYDYKFTLLGEQRNLDNLTIYRSGMHLLFNGGTAAANSLQEARRRLGNWARDAAHHESKVLRLAAQSYNRLRARGAPAQERSTERSRAEEKEGAG